MDLRLLVKKLIAKIGINLAVFVCFRTFLVILIFLVSANQHTVLMGDLAGGGYVARDRGQATCRVPKSGGLGGTCPCKTFFSQRNFFVNKRKAEKS